MHIIKITPQSFKIILSKQDVKAYGVEDIFESKTLSEEFFLQIIEETNRLYDNPFGEGAIDAEFFESKDGGGELFLSLCKNKTGKTVLVFSTQNSDDLFCLCARLIKLSAHEKSTLYLDGNTYRLVIYINENKHTLLPIVKEYGSCDEAGKLTLWHIDEHANVLCRDKAIETVAKFT